MYLMYHLFSLDSIDVSIAYIKLVIVTTYRKTRIASKNTNKTLLI